MSEIKVDKISPADGSANTTQIGDSGDTITLPSGVTLTVTSGLALTSGGTGLTSAGSANQSLKMNSGGSALEYGTLPIAGGGTGATSASAARTALGVAIGSDVQAFDSDTAKIDVQQTFTKAQIASTYTGTGLTLDFDTYQNFIITLASGANSLANPTTEASQVGQTGWIIFIQPSSGSAATLTLGSEYESPAGGGIALTGTNSKYDVVGYVVKADNSILLLAPQADFS